MQPTTIIALFLSSEADESARKKVNDIIDAFGKKHPDISSEQTMLLYGEVYAALREQFMQGATAALSHVASINAEAPDA